MASLAGVRVGVVRLLSTAVVAGAVLAGSSAVALGAVDGGNGGVSCSVYSGIPVALAAGQPENYSITGELCATPVELASGETVQLLIHGATYNHTYWDFGTIDGVSYSYARDLAAAGFATFAIDEIGAGQSSHPLSSDITIDVAAYVAHEIVQDLRDGVIAHTKFAKVIEVGHSFGSFTTWVEAATYHDVAGAIITGAAHDTTVFSESIAADSYPAIDDPKFADSGLDPGYLTTKPGTRGSIFYNPADSDPNVIAQDEATKDVISSTEIATGEPLEESTITQQIDVPVLVILGGDDNLFCGAEVDGASFSCSSGQELASEEASYYSPAAELRACIVPNSGHDINLALNHDLEEADAIAWSYDYVGQRGLPTDQSGGLSTDCNTA
jgi:pimeloyl-ACP methyl ester carboxylesterase